jgi:hypothetical protein
MPDPQRRYPTVVIVLLQLSNGLMLILSLMSAAQQRVHWRSYLLQVTGFYHDHITVHLRSAVRTAMVFLANRFEVDLTWASVWIADYIPIASTFFFGFAVAYCHVAGTTLWRAVYDFGVSEIAPEFRRSFENGMIALGLSLVLFVLLFIASPVFFVVLPVVMVSLYLGMMATVLVLWFVIARWFAINVVPWVILTVVLFYVWRRQTAAEHWRALRRTTREAPARLGQWFAAQRLEFSAGLRGLPSDLSTMRAEVSENLRFWRRIVVLQYATALAIGLLFLVVIAINGSLAE